MNIIKQIINQVITIGAKQGADDCLRALQQGLKAGGGTRDDVSKLLAAVDDAIKSQDYVARITSQKIDDSMTVASKYVDDEAKAQLQKVRQAATKRVTPEIVETPIEKKIRTIKDRLKPQQEAYNRENKAFRNAQQKHIDKFNSYVDSYTTKYTELVGKLDSTTDPKEIAKIGKELQKLEAQAEKTIKNRLEKLGTLSQNEIQSKIQEVKNLAQTRVQNATYASANSNNARAQAEAFIKEVSQEFKTYNRELTPEQLKFMLDKRVAKLEQLVMKAKLEDKTTLKRTINFGGMQVPVEIPVMGTSATDEIAKICGGKSPKEALEHYKTLQRKMNDAIGAMDRANISQASGYLQINERKIHIPIKDSPKPKELKWLEQQLKEKTTMLEEEISHTNPSFMVSKT